MALALAMNDIDIAEHFRRDTCGMLKPSPRQAIACSGRPSKRPPLPLPLSLRNPHPPLLSLGDGTRKKGPEEMRCLPDVAARLCATLHVFGAVDQDKPSAMDTGSDPNSARMRRLWDAEHSRTRQMNTTRAIATCYSTVIPVRQRLSTRLGLLSYLL